MRPTSYGSSPIVHFIGIAFPPFLAHLAYRSAVDEFVRGEMLRIPFVTLLASFAGLLLWLYLRSGILRY